MKINSRYTEDYSVHQKFRIEEALNWLCNVLNSDEFKWKARHFPERDAYLKNINGFVVNFKRLYPERNRPMLYIIKEQAVSVNFKYAFNFPKEKMASYIGHEIGHEWFNHEEFETDSFLGFIQYKVKFMQGRSNWYYKFLLWINQIFT